MKIYIAVDMEGVSGIFCPEQVLPGGALYEQGRDLAAGDVNVCAKACKDAGADSVIVRDAHSAARNLDIRRLTEDVDELISGDVGCPRFPGLSECDGLLLIGYHAMAGTAGAVLEHTFSSKAVQNYWLSGRPVGEIAVDAAIAAECGVPCLLVSGDDKACREAEKALPGVRTACVKTGVTTTGARLLPLHKAHRVLYDAVLSAVQTMAQARTYPPATPVRLRAELTERTPLPRQAGRDDLHWIDGRTFEITAPTVEEALARI